MAGAATLRVLSHPFVDIRPLMDEPAQTQIILGSGTQPDPRGTSAPLVSSSTQTLPDAGQPPQPSHYLYGGEKYTRLEMLVAVNASLTLLVGVFQLVMYVLRLGFLTALFSNAMVSGYTTGVAVHVFSSQISYLLGYRVDSHHGPLNLVFVCYAARTRCSGLYIYID